MPRKVTFKVDAIDELYRQLRYAPPEARKRQMDAAEQLVAEIDPGRNYPESYVIYKITDYRPEPRENESTLVGEALLPDLVNFVLRLSEDLSLDADDPSRKGLTMAQVSARLNVAHKTIQRYRQKGLVCHSMIHADGSRRLGCFEDALERFITKHEAQLHRAASFSRLDEQREREVIETARRRAVEASLSLNAVARELAERYGRAHETMRQLLLRHDRDSDEPIFTGHSTLSDRDARLIYRAWRRGIAMNALTQRFDRTPATIHRTINRQRTDRLQSLDLRYVNLPTFNLDDAGSILLSAAVLNQRLDDVLPMNDAIELLNAIHAGGETALREDDEASLIAGYNWLKKRAAELMADLDAWPGARAIDAIETDLRWATLLKRRLASAALLGAIKMIEQHLGKRLTSQPTEIIRSHIELALVTLGSVIETIDPGKSQRIERLSRFAIAKAMARKQDTGHQRAAARHHAGSISLSPYPGLTGWQALLDLPQRLAQHVDELEASLCTVIRRRYGLDGRPPQTCAALASELGVTDTAVTRTASRAMAELRRIARADETT
jgi:RNA polymerase primary sigma factor